MTTQKPPLWLEHLPQRAGKPRRAGLNLARDNGLPVEGVVASLRAHGHMVDYLKLRQFVAWYLPVEQLRAKIAAAREHDVRTFLGGTVLEAAHLHGRTDEALDAMVELGLDAVEISNSVVPLDAAQLGVVTRRAIDRGLEVLFEYGNKAQAGPIDPVEAASDIAELRASGATYIIVERALLDLTLGADGSADTAGRLVELVERVGLEHLVFEAETLPHQAWLIRTLGDDVSLGPNIDLDDVPTRIEPMRHGLGRWVEWDMFNVLRERTAVDPTQLLRQ